MKQSFIRMSKQIRIYSVCPHHPLVIQKKSLLFHRITWSQHGNLQSHEANTDIKCRKVPCLLRQFLSLSTRGHCFTHVKSLIQRRHWSFLNLQTQHVSFTHWLIPLSVLSNAIWHVRVYHLLQSDICLGCGFYYSISFIVGTLVDAFLH